MRLLPHHPQSGTVNTVSGSSGFFTLWLNCFSSIVFLVVLFSQASAEYTTEFDTKDIKKINDFHKNRLKDSPLNENDVVISQIPSEQSLDYPQNGIVDIAKKREVETAESAMEKELNAQINLIDDQNSELELMNKNHQIQRGEEDLHNEDPTDIDYLQNVDSLGYVFERVDTSSKPASSKNLLSNDIENSRIIRFDSEKSITDLKSIFYSRVEDEKDRRRRLMIDPDSPIFSEAPEIIDPVLIDDGKTEGDNTGKILVSEDTVLRQQNPLEDPEDEPSHLKLRGYKTHAVVMEKVSSDEFDTPFSAVKMDKWNKDTVDLMKNLLEKSKKTHRAPQTFFYPISSINRKSLRIAFAKEKRFRKFEEKRKRRLRLRKEK